MSGILFGFVVLWCLILSGHTYLLVKLRPCSQEQTRVSPRCKLTLLEWQIVVFIKPILFTFISLLPVLQTIFKSLCQRWITLLRIILAPLHSILVIYMNLAILEREKEYLGWICVTVFLEVLRMMVYYENLVSGFSFVLRDQRRQQRTETSQQGSNALHLCNVIVYMFGAAGLVLLSSVTLTAELILKARNGERVLKDLRVIVFPFECVFALYWLVLQMHAYWKIVTTESLHNQRNTHQRHRRQLRNTAESREMENWSAPVSAVSQTL